jgi:outer membrane receptor protein involved in Fe transport
MKSSLLCSAGAALAFAVATMSTTFVRAEAPDNDTKANQVSEVVVTANKVEQRLQDVPLSVSAVTKEELKARDVKALDQMEYAIPGLSTIQYAPGLQYVQLNGVSSVLGNQTVGFYIDEMPFGGDQVGSNPDVRLLDMERVEVLRGPQGTLYGEGSMGGTIKYITASPNLTQFSGSFEGEYGSVADGGSSYQGTAVLNVPIVQDKVGLRLAGAYEHDGGWIDNVVSGQKDINRADLSTIRGKLLFKPDDRSSVSLLVLHQTTDQPDQNFGTNGKSFESLHQSLKDTYTLANGVLNYDFGATNLVESIGYIDRTITDQYDVTPFYLPLLDLIFGLPPGYITQIPLDADTKVRVFTNETRFSSANTGPFNWTVGAYYRRSQYDSVGGTSTAPGALPVAILTDEAHVTSSSWALFGEGNYQITDKLNFLIGLRYFENRLTQTTQSTSLGFPALDHNSGVFHTLNPRFNLRYEFSPTSMVYFNAAKGFRSGGFNLTSAGGGVFTIPPTYQPDSIWTYEAGTKQELLDRKLDIDADVYYSDWQNVQSSEFAPGSAITIVANGGQVSGWGLDFAAAAHPMDGLTLSGIYGWNNLAYTDSTADKDKGDPVDMAAHNSASLSFDYRRPMGADNEGFFRTDYQHAGPAQITLRNFGGQIIHLPERDTVNMRLGMDVGRYEASLFVTNLTDDRAPLIPGPFGVILQNVEQRPRVIGVNVKAHF